MTGRAQAAVVLVVTLAAASTALAACAPQRGALRSLGDGGGTVCTPVDAQGRAVVGLSAIANDSDEAIAFTGVELVGAENVELIGLELRELDDADANVVGLSYERFGPAALDAPLTMPAASERLLLVGLRSIDGSEGSVDALRIEYAARPWSASVVQTAVAMRVVPEGTACSM